jgi:hypothetical protein
VLTKTGLPGIPARIKQQIRKITYKLFKLHEKYFSHIS